MGQWSVNPPPVCSKIGSCLELEQIENGRNVPLVGSRGSAFKFRCRKGYKLYGEKNTHCMGDHWSHKRLPVCAGFFGYEKGAVLINVLPGKGCDPNGLLNIPYGEARSILGGRVYRCIFI